MLQRGAQLGQYKIVRFLGEGGMGEVYEALHIELNKRVALKTLRPQTDNNPQVRERFLREGRSAARLRHPHIVDVFDAGQADGLVFLVMELLEGEDLADVLKREHRLSVERAVDLMLPVMAAVSNVHEQGIIHRDLKPQNIFLARGPYGEPVPKVLDFGISKVTALEGALTTAGEALGSPYYMSPEQSRGVVELDGRSDEFGLGVILYELVTGVRPFEAQNLMALLYAIQNENPMPPRQRVPEITAEFEAAMMRALERDPARRYPSVFEFGKALIPFAGERARMLWTPLYGTVTPAARSAEPAQDARPRSRSSMEETQARPASPPPPPAYPTLPPVLPTVAEEPEPEPEAAPAAPPMPKIQPVAIRSQVVQVAPAPTAAPPVAAAPAASPAVKPISPVARSQSMPAFKDPPSLSPAPPVARSQSMPAFKDPAPSLTPRPPTRVPPQTPRPEPRGESRPPTPARPSTKGHPAVPARPESKPPRAVSKPPARRDTPISPKTPPLPLLVGPRDTPPMPQPAARRETPSVPSAALPKAPPGKRPVPSSQKRRETPPMPLPARAPGPPGAKDREKERLRTSGRMAAVEAAPPTPMEVPAVPEPAPEPAVPEASPEGQLVCLASSEPRVAEAVREFILASPRVVLLLEAKGPAPERRPPLTHVINATVGYIDIVVLSEEGGGGWRDPMGDLCKEFAPETYNAKACYLFIEHGALAHVIKKDLWNPLLDAERITDWVAERFPGAQRYKRPKEP